MELQTAGALGENAPLPYNGEKKNRHGVEGGGWKNAERSEWGGVALKSRGGGGGKTRLFLKGERLCEEVAAWWFGRGRQGDRGMSQGLGVLWSSIGGSRGERKKRRNTDGGDSG